MCCTLDTKALLFCEMLDCIFSSRDRNIDRLVHRLSPVFAVFKVVLIDDGPSSSPEAESC